LYLILFTLASDDRFHQHRTFAAHGLSDCSADLVTFRCSCANVGFGDAVQQTVDFAGEKNVWISVDFAMNPANHRSFSQAELWSRTT